MEEPMIRPVLADHEVSRTVVSSFVVNVVDFRPGRQGLAKGFFGQKSML